jgi:hypothetical protein
MGKKHDSEAFNSGTKKDTRPNRVLLPVEVVRVLHANWLARDRWKDVHLPSGG